MYGLMWHDERDNAHPMHSNCTHFKMLNAADAKEPFCPHTSRECNVNMSNENVNMCAFVAYITATMHTHTAFCMILNSDVWWLFHKRFCSIPNGGVSRDCLSLHFFYCASKWKHTWWQWRENERHTKQTQRKAKVQRTAHNDATGVSSLHSRPVSAVANGGRQRCKRIGWHKSGESSTTSILYCEWVNKTAVFFLFTRNQRLTRTVEGVPFQWQEHRIFLFVRCKCRV